MSENPSDVIIYEEPKLVSNRPYILPSKYSDYPTPRKLYNEWNEREGPFTLDPCASQENALCEKYYTTDEDGLSKSWAGEKVFMNPPYGKVLGKWVQKAWVETQQENTLVVGLLPARTDVKWFHTYVIGKAEIHFLKGRLKFGTENSAPFPSMVVIWRYNEVDLYWTLGALS